jgi:hypothetical protein
MLIEEHHDLASRALARKAVLQASGALTERAFAPGAFDLNGIVHGTDGKPAPVKEQ